LWGGPASADLERRSRETHYRKREKGRRRRGSVKGTGWEKEGKICKGITDGKGGKGQGQLTVGKQIRGRDRRGGDVDSKGVGVENQKKRRITKLDGRPKESSCCRDRGRKKE